MISYQALNVVAGFPIVAGVAPMGAPAHDGALTRRIKTANFNPRRLRGERLC